MKKAAILIGIFVAVHLVLFVASSSNDRDAVPQVLGIAHGWNKFSRCSVIRLTQGNGGVYYRIIHDNALSTVNLKNPYVPGTFRTPRSVGDAVETPFLLRNPIEDVLVMFAGCGDEMVRFQAFSGGTADITGVELNGLVPELAMTTPELAPFEVKAFLTTLPNVRMKVQEGRSYLERESKKFDVIFIGSKANTFQHITGGTRKYLDTVEAYEQYLDHLKPGGLLVLDHQPLGPVVDSLQRVFAQRRRNWNNSVVMFRSGIHVDLVVAPDGFSKEQMADILNRDPQRNILYAPFVKTSSPESRRVTTPLDPAAKAITDDRPFDWDLDFGQYTLFPTAKQLGNFVYYLGWMRITTLILMVAVALTFIAIAAYGKERRPPAPVLGYLIVSGFCYLLVEVAFMARLELLLADPLVSMATVLSVFLLASGLGSMIFDRFQSRIHIVVLPFVVAAVVAMSILALDTATRRLVGTPLPLRLGAAVALIMPVSMGLGMFYPYAVAALVHAGRERAVPITYGISTLSSVIGATYAMTMMISWGYDRLLWHATAGYLSLGLLIVVTRFGRRFPVT